jgi:hypothetical protein
MAEENPEIAQNQLTEAEGRLARAQESLFGKHNPYDSEKPVDLSDKETTKQTVQDVLQAALDLTKAEKDNYNSNGVTWKEAIKPNQEAPNFEQPIAEFERALDIVDGKRALPKEQDQPDNLTQVWSRISDARKVEADEMHKARVDSLPNLRGFVGRFIGLPKQVSAGHLAAENIHHERQVQRIEEVRNFVTENAPSWARQPNSPQLTPTS